MLALAFLTIATAAEHTQPPPGLAPLTRNEIARLAAALILQPAATQAACCTGPPGAGVTSPDQVIGLALGRVLPGT